MRATVQILFVDAASASSSIYMLIWNPNIIYIRSVFARALQLCELANARSKQ